MKAARNLFRRTWAFAGHLGTAWFVISSVGLGPAIASALVTGATVAGTFLEGLPISVVAVAGWCALAASLVIFTAPKWLKIVIAGQALSKSAHESWDHVNEFMLFQAACLWAGQEPTYPLPPGEPYARFTMLKEAIRNKELNIHGPLNQTLAIHQRKEGAVHAKLFVTRSALKNFAEKKGLRPRFLFPDT